MAGFAAFELDHKGVGEVLASPEIHAVINGLAGQIAATVRAALPGRTEVVVESYTTDRGAAAVVIKDRRGMGWQARDGVLTRAAGAAGLEVRAR
ncbi:hypothetical protein [Microtetraspora niveoalba]|uniref:hypothetical protein n=1 Tax=Microtetraspora niveoalba TaxID=46175 RepID=UPI0008361010|nr:hypothetical protein [Microtetraspora niveoalba]